jgi:hypothetical protein
MQIKIVAKGLDQAVKKLSKDQTGTMRTSVRKIADIYRNMAREEAPKKTGKFAAGISKSSVGYLSWNINEGKKLGAIIRNGSLSHIIRPKKAKALYWPGLPHPVAWAAHPGTKPNPYDERAVSRGDAPAQAELDRLGARLATELGGG